MSDDLRPGKGIHADATSESLKWLYEAVGAVVDAYEEAGGDATVDGGEGKEILRKLRDDYEWTVTKDKFGLKVHTAIAWGDGEYRITLVQPERGGFKVDIRQWYKPGTESSF